MKEQKKKKRKKIKLGEPRSDKTPSQYQQSIGLSKRVRAFRALKKRHWGQIREEKREARWAQKIGELLGKQKEGEGDDRAK